MKYTDEAPEYFLPPDSEEEEPAIDARSESVFSPGSGFIQIQIQIENRSSSGKHPSAVLEP
jgi:hypothetical protein